MNLDLVRSSNSCLVLFAFSMRQAIIASKVKVIEGKESQGLSHKHGIYLATGCPTQEKNKKKKKRKKKKEEGGEEKEKEEEGGGEKEEEKKKETKTRGRSHVDG